MAKILRGDIYWADLNPTVGHEQSGLRPVVVLSHEVFNTNSGTVIAMAMTSQAPRAGFPLTYEVMKAKLPKQSWVKISQIRTISTLRLRERLSTIPNDELDTLIDGLNEIIAS